MADGSLFSAREIAVALGVNERTVRRWIDAGELPAVKERGQLRVDLDAAKARFASSRAAKIGEQAEWRGRYLEVRERLAEVESELAGERERRIRLELVLYPPRAVA